MLGLIILSPPDRQSGTITQLCKVTLTPLVISGIEIVRQDKVCKLEVNGNGNNNNNGGNENGNNTSTTTTATENTTTSATENATSTSSFTSTSESSSSAATTLAGTVDAGVSVIVSLANS